MPEVTELTAVVEPEQVTEECTRAVQKVRALMARLHSQVSSPQVSPNERSLAERGGFEPPVEI
ncbi:MAG: hypothetical protein LAO79_20895 [Acidobacteriia bacterium]|nr:hypothetical protein [Terriglobia bacterium]